MTSERFDNLTEETFNKVITTLGVKKNEYTPKLDRLANFKSAAKLQNETPIEALGGMLAKHVISVYDYISRSAEGEYISIDSWDEKIIDVINYMILLRGLVEEHNNMVTD